MIQSDSDRKELRSGNSVDDDNDDGFRLIDVDQAIIVSDIHIGYEKSNVKSFIKFLDDLMITGKIKDYSLFILGDLFDLWRRRDSIFYPESDRILSLINQFMCVYYIPGNHDYTILDATQHFPDFNCYKISKYFRVKSKNTSFFLLHGHELEVISKLPYLKIEEYNKISDQICRMNDQEGKIASYLHELYHRIAHKRQPSISDLLQSPEQRKDMDAIDKLARSKAKYPLLGMQLEDILVFGHTHRPYNDIENKAVNVGAWLSDMEVPKWFEENYGPGNACAGWYVEINNGEYSLRPYDIHRKTQEEQKNTERQQQPGQGRRQQQKQKGQGQNEFTTENKASLPRLFQKFFRKSQIER